MQDQNRTWNVRGSGRKKRRLERRLAHKLNVRIRKCTLQNPFEHLSVAGTNLLLDWVHTSLGGYTCEFQDRKLRGTSQKGHSWFSDDKFTKQIQILKTKFLKSFFIFAIVSKSRGQCFLKTVQIRWFIDLADTFSRYVLSCTINQMLYSDQKYAISKNVLT